MKEFKNKVAVITGGAGGIGLALAERAVQEGMKVVIADIRQPALAEAEAKLRAAGGDVTSLVINVRRVEDIQALFQKAIDTYGKVNLLVNNAGVFASGLTWATSVEEYRWVVDVNLMSVIYGITTFVPHMIAGGEECHVVNIASGAGILTSPGFCTYSTAKHAVVALSECLYLDLLTHQVPNVGVTLVMPGYVQSDVMNPDKVAPSPAVAQELGGRLQDPVFNGVEMMMRQGVEAGMPAATAADLVFHAIEEKDLYLAPNGAAHLDGARLIAQGRVECQNFFPQMYATA